MEQQHKLDRAKQILLEKEIMEIRAELKRNLEFERDYHIQMNTERDIKVETELSSTNQKIVDIAEDIEQLRSEINQLKDQKLEIERLAIILSDLSLQLMNTNQPNQKKS